MTYNKFIGSIDITTTIHGGCDPDLAAARVLHLQSVETALAPAELLSTILGCGRIGSSFSKRGELLCLSLGYRILHSSWLGLRLG